MNKSGNESIPFLPKVRGFKMASLNIASLVLHIDELRILLAKQCLDVLCLNETRLDSTISDNIVHIDGYEIIRRDRNRNGGGVCIYIRTSMTYSLRNDFANDQYETLSIDISKPNSSPFNVTALYRPPGCDDDFFVNLENIISTLDNEHKDYYLLGDLNCNYLSEVCNSQLSQLKLLSQVYQLNQLIDEPTRITSTTKTLIDVIFTNDCSRIVASGVSHVAISDHSLVYTIRKIAIPTQNTHKYITTRDFKNFNPEKFKADLSSIPWNTINNCESPEEMLNVWQHLFTTVADKHAPIRTKRVRHKKSPWITPHIRTLIINRNKLKRKAVINNTPDLWCDFKKVRNAVNNEIKEAKATFYRSQIESSLGNPKAIWNTINQLTHRKKTSTTSIRELKIDGKSFTEPVDLCEILNNHFIQVGSNLASSIPVSETNFKDYVKPVNTSFCLQKTTETIVLKLLNKLQVHKATGLDNISSRLIKVSAPIISDSLTVIINKSIETGIFPSQWKYAKVFPLFKANDRTDRLNYRPISVLPMLSKICERIVYDQLYTYLSKNNILNKYQSGFRSLHSTVTALLDATNEWYLNMDNDMINLITFLDLAKAFDTVSHHILLEKLNVYGICGKSLDWFASYLSNRQQSCVVEGHISKPQKITCGVPQGSILGPLLFLLFINDLPTCLQYTKARMYADDTSLSAASKSTSELQSHVKCDLDSIHKWLKANKLSLNVTKTEYMYIATSFKLANLGRIFPITIGNQPIKRVKSTKCLGVYFDENMSWSKHIDHLSKKVCRSINGLKQARKFVPKQTLVSIYNALTQPYFDYCDTVWGNLSKGPSSCLQKLQNRAARIITFQGYDTRSADILEELNWENLSQRRDKHLCLMVYKALNNKVPGYLNDLFVKCSDYISYRSKLRDSEINLALTRTPKTECFKGSFSYRGVQMWNSLPHDFKIPQSLTTFKNKLSDLKNCHCVS